MYFHNLLEDVFQDRDKALALLKKYDLESALEKAVDQINDVLSKPPVSVLSLVRLAPIILFAVNSRMASITDPVDKLNLEMMVSDVAHHLIKRMLKECRQPKTALQEIKASLRTAADFGRYNFDALLGLLQYDVLEKLYLKDETYWYEWNGLIHELDILADGLKSLRVIKSVKDFKRLFDRHDNAQLHVQFSDNCAPFLIAVFDELKNKKLITARGGTGHFHPLSSYGYNSKDEFLMKTEPRFIKKNAKRNPEKWKKLENKAKELVEPLKAPATSKPPRTDDGQMGRIAS